MEASVFLALFFFLIVATVREFGISGQAEAAEDEPPPMIRFNVEDRHGRESHRSLCGGALVVTNPHGIVITTSRCWDLLRSTMGTFRTGGRDPVVYAIMNPNEMYPVASVVDTIPTPRTDPDMDHVAKQLVLMKLAADEGISEIPFLYQPNLDDIQGYTPLVGIIHTPLQSWLSLGTSADLVGSVADSWDKPYFPLTGVNYIPYDMGTPLYVKKNDHIRYLLGLRVSEHRAINVRKLTTYVTDLVELPWRAIDG